MTTHPSFRSKNVDITIDGEIEPTIAISFPRRDAVRLANGSRYVEIPRHQLLTNTAPWKAILDALGQQ